MTDNEQTEIQRFLGDLDTLTESAQLISEPTEISSTTDLTEIRRFLNES